jgi:hypothetical protein
MSGGTVLRYVTRLVLPVAHVRRAAVRELLKRLQSRRSFLKGSALLAASTLAVPAVLSAQAQDQSSQQD